MSRFRLAPLQNWRLKLPALLAAAFLWAFFAFQPGLERSFGAVIHYVGLSKDLELNPDQAASVTVVVRGHANQLERLGRGPLTLRLDFSEIVRSGEHTFNVTTEALGLPAGLELVKAVPSQVRLSLERKVRRRVPVQPRFVGAYQPGYVMESFSVDPPELVVVGPESRMALFDQVSTDPIDLGEVVGNSGFHAEAYVPDSYVRFEGKSSVRVDVQMRKRQ
jgi:YbbR domain-containing protein